MTSNDNTPIIPPWYLSRTVWASIVAFLINIANQIGFHVDPFWSQSLPDYLLNISWGLSAGFAIYLHIRSKKAITKALATPSNGKSP